MKLAALPSSPLTVADDMSKPVILAKVTESLEAVAARMANYAIRRLPVVDEIGVFSCLNPFQLPFLTLRIVNGRYH